jgi:hypothetical protein
VINGAPWARGTWPLFEWAALGYRLWSPCSVPYLKTDTTGLKVQKRSFVSLDSDNDLVYTRHPRQYMWIGRYVHIGFHGTYYTAQYASKLGTGRVARHAQREDRRT